MDERFRLTVELTVHALRAEAALEGLDHCRLAGIKPVADGRQLLDGITGLNENLREDRASGLGQEWPGGGMSCRTINSFTSEITA